MKTIFDGDGKLIAVYLESTNQIFVDSDTILTKEQVDKLKEDYSKKVSVVEVEHLFTSEELEGLGVELDDILWEGVG